MLPLDLNHPDEEKGAGRGAFGIDDVDDVGASLCTRLLLLVTVILPPDGVEQVAKENVYENS